MPNNNNNNNKPSSSSLFTILMILSTLITFFVRTSRSALIVIPSSSTKSFERGISSCLVGRRILQRIPTTTTTTTTSKLFSSSKSLPPEFSVEGNDDDDDNDDDWYSDYDTTKPSNRQQQQRFNRFESRPDDFTTTKRNTKPKPQRQNKSTTSTTTFRDDFRGTRVFVQNIPLDTTWQTLKDHFRTAGDVIFASVSVNPDGSSKGCGVVQYETTKDAQNAIQIMREHPLNGNTLYVRPDVQESSSSNPSASTSATGRGRRSSTYWKCANEENATDDFLSPEQRTKVETILKARDAARRRRNYEASDAMRQDLKDNYNVHIDDRLKLWWTSADNSVPDPVSTLKGDGLWDQDKKKRSWRQIPTTPENDACVNPNLVAALLKQRDAARMEKDFVMADALLDEARNCPDGDLYLRIHDESRTWRIWTDDPPPRVKERKDPVVECLELVREYSPEKEEEVKELLERFKGREWNILKKLKQKYKETGRID